MTPIFSSKKSAPLDAGQTSDGVQFTNAPWVQVNTASKPLFTGENTVDGEVLYDLLSYVNSTTVWNNVTRNNTTPISGSAYTALTCEDFGKLDTSTKNAQLLVTLYKDTIVNSSSKAVQWQVVYRSMDGTSDVLTLYMSSCYRYDSMFATSENMNYITTDSLREFASTGDSSLQHMLEDKYGTNYLVAPKDMPSSWQSTTNQPDSDGDVSFSKDNGLDNVDDLLWVPSGYEVYTVGTEKEYGDVTSVSSISNAAATLQVIINGYKYTNIDTTTTNGRTGLWRMSAYDRTVGQNAQMWLRSGYYSSSDSAIYARTIGDSGGSGCDSVNNTNGFRVALHLSLDSLAEQQLCKVSASVSGSWVPCGISTDSRNLQTVNTTYNYKNYLVPNNTTEKGSATATFSETSTTKIKSFTLKIGTSYDRETINVSGSSGSGTATDICDYEYTYSSGKLTVKVSNLSAVGSTTQVIANAAASYTVTFNSNGGTGGPSSLSVSSGSTTGSITPPTREYYTFLGYYNSQTGGTQYVNASGTGIKAITSNITLYAQWKGQEVTLNFYVNKTKIKTTKSNYESTYGAGGWPTESQINSALPTGYKWEGYWRENYTTNSAGVQYGSSTWWASNETISKTSTTINLYAGLKTTITANANGGSISSSSWTTKDIVVGSKISELPSATKTGYSLNNWWTTSSGGTQVTTSTTFDKPTTIYAHWSAITYSITYNLDGGSISGQKTSYTIETSTFTLQTPTKAGYTFSGWTGSNGTTPQTSVSITKGSTGNKTYTANWTLDIANVTLSITLNNSGRQYMIYILDSTGQPKHQFVVQKTGNIKFTISKNEKFSVLVFETLYMTTTIDGETTRKKVYNSGVSTDKTIAITISSASNQVNNWLIV